MSKNEPNAPLVEEAPPIEKTSRMQKVGTVLVWAGITAIPVTYSAMTIRFSWKITEMNLETARLTLDAAKLNNATALLNAGK